MKTFLEPWKQSDLYVSGDTQACVIDSAGVPVCVMPLGMGPVGIEYARRIVACVNALRTLSTEEIERCVTDPPDYWLPVYDSPADSAKLRILEAPAPEREIEYDSAEPVEVEDLDGKTTYLYGVKMTHEQAAEALRDGSWVSL